MKLSILILTHNRPKLFKRCIESVLNNLPAYDIEIIINNDTRDIQELYSDQVCVKYFYEQNDDLSAIYEMLYNKASGEYIYFLEDDDYLQPNFFKDLDYTYDVNYLEYISNPLIQGQGVLSQFKRMTINRCIRNITLLEEFIKKYNPRDFQLGQILFKRSLITEFPAGNNTYNDIKLFESLARESITIKYITNQRWVQTIDGQDNISFSDLSNNKRFSISIKDIKESGDPDYKLVSFSWDLTTVCQYRCSYCYALPWLTKKFNSENINAYAQVLKRLKLNSLPAFKMEILGGEPMLHDHIYEIVDELCSMKKCISVTINTNLAKDQRFYERFNNRKYKKLTISASFHPEQVTDVPAYCDKLKKISEYDGPLTHSNINLYDREEYIVKYIHIIKFCLKYNIRVGANYLLSTETYKSNYTDDFFEKLNLQEVDWYTPNSSWKIPSLYKTWPGVSVDRHPGAFSIRFVDLKDNIIYYDLGEAKELKLHGFKNFNCRPKMWQITPEGGFYNECTRDKLSMLNNNINKCIKCPRDVCGNDELYFYHKTAPGEPLPEN